MEPEKKICPKLYPICQSLDKKWFIKYYKFDYNTAKVNTHKYYGVLNLISDKDERIEKAKYYIECINNGTSLPDHSGQRKIYNFHSDDKHYSIQVILLKSMDQLKIQVTKRTFNDYAGKLKLFVSYLSKIQLINKPIINVDTIVANDFLIYLKIEKNYSNKTINTYKFLLSKLFKNAIYLYKLKNNPFENIKKLRDDSKSFESYPKTLEALINNTLPQYNLQLYLATQFIFYILIRIDELRYLQVKNIDFINQVVIIHKKTTKSRVERKIIIPNQLLLLLKQFKIDTYDLNDYIFSKNNLPGNKMISYNYLRNQFKKYRIKFNIPQEYKLYGIKHTSNERLAMTGVNANLQQRHNGHTSLEYTQKYNAGLTTLDLQSLKTIYPTFGKN